MSGGATGRAHLVGRPGGTGLVLVERPGRLPEAVWTGVVTADLTADDVAALAPAGRSLLPEHSHGWWGRPGLSGHRGAGEPGAWSSWFVPTSVTATAGGARVEAADAGAGLGLVTEVEALAGGALRARHTLTNTGATDYVLDHLDVVVPVPDRVAESLDFTGRWARERVPQRRELGDGLWLRESRRGKTAEDATTVLVAGTRGFGFGHGEVWGVHVGWSGNSTHRLERVPLGRTAPSATTLGGGELLLPGEMTLAPATSYTTPWVYLAAAADGLDGLAAAFHGFARSLPAHPSTPRPVTLNVWEAVYFDHDLDRLTELARRAAAVGVERYVLDDGWFGARRHDRAGLGDWTVSPDAWPQGLGVLVERVRELGMQFGLWFEPEMVNADSDLFRAHPDWILSTGGRVPAEERHQQVLDLARPGAYAHVLEQMSAVLAAHDIGYVKWDHNRDLLDAGSGAAAGRPGVHTQTLAFYRLLDELRARFPDVEWESCSSGGGRVDLGVVERTQRVWTSDQNDALARQSIQRWTVQLLAPEYLGAHVAAPVSHQTGRTFDLDFRAGTALFGHFGIEWDITTASEADLAALRGWTRLYRDHRALLHGGRLLRVDTAQADCWVHGVVAPDRSEALVAVVQLDELAAEPPRVVVPGLDPARRYRVRRVSGGADPQPAWTPPAEATGAALATVGLPGVPAAPLSVVLVHLS